MLASTLCAALRSHDHGLRRRLVGSIRVGPSRFLGRVDRVANPPTASEDLYADFSQAAGGRSELRHGWDDWLDERAFCDGRDGRLGGFGLGARCGRKA